MDQDTIIQTLLGVVVMGLGAAIRRLFSRVDELEKDKAGKDSTDKRFDQAFSAIEKHEANAARHMEEVSKDMHRMAESLVKVETVLQERQK